MKRRTTRFGPAMVAAAISIFAASGSVDGAPNAKAPVGTTTIRARHGAVRLPTGEMIELRDHVLEVRKDAGRATAPVDSGATDLERVDLRPDGSMRLVFSRICPPPLMVDLSSGWTRARLTAAEAKDLGAKPSEALAKLSEALTADPSQDDLRVEAARIALAIGRKQEAVSLLRQGMRERPAPTYWALASDPSLESLRADLLPIDRSPLLQANDDGAVRTVLWAPARRWIAVAERLNPIVLRTVEGEEILALAIVTAADVNDAGDVLPRARKQVRECLAKARDVLAALGFETQSGQWKDAVGPRTENRLLFSPGEPVVSIRDNALSFRPKGKPAVVAKLFNMGALGIDSGFLPRTTPFVLDSWSRVAGNDECPNERGVVIFPIP